MTKILIASVAAAACVFLCLAITVGGTSFTRSPSTTADPVLVLHWPASQRVNAAVLIDDRPLPVPASGAVEYKVEAGTRRLLVRRKGYQQVEMSVTCRAGERHHCLLPWLKKDATGEKPATVEVSVRTDKKVATTSAADDKTARNISPTASKKVLANHSTPQAGGRQHADEEPKITPSFDAWLQDFEQAKRTAAAERKDVLIAFDGSDWCGWSIRMANEIFHCSDFYQRVGKDYVLVFIDFPRRPEAQAKVHDPERNDRLRRQFQVEGFPTVILTDAQGQVFGVIGGFVAGGVEAFRDRLDQCRKVRTALKERLDAVEAAEDVDAKLIAIVKAVTEEDQPCDILEEGRGCHSRSESASICGLFLVATRRPDLAGHL